MKPEWCPACGSLEDHEIDCHLSKWNYPGGAIVSLMTEEYFEQRLAAQIKMRESHERMIACGAQWDGQDGYVCPRTEGTCQCLTTPRKG